MVIRKLEAKDLKEAQILWNNAFLDSFEYIDFVFENHVTLENSMAIFVRNVLVCMLFLLPKRIVIKDQIHETFFIVGVATHPDYRYQGYAKKLMQAVHEMLSKKGVPFVFLYPFKHEFYEKLGYVTINHMKTVDFVGQKKEVNGYQLKCYDDLSDGLVIKLLDIYERHTQQFDAFFDRNMQEFKIALGGLFIDGGKVLIIGDQTHDKGYMLYYEKDASIQCVESLFLDRQSMQAMISMTDTAGFLYCNHTFWVKGAKKIPYAMVKILDIQYRSVLRQKVLILDQY